MAQVRKNGSVIMIDPSLVTFMPAFKMYRHLTELALLYCQRIGNVGLLEVGQGCKFLQALHLVDCSSIGDEAMCGIAKGCRNLKKLHIRRCYKVISLWDFCRF